MIITGDATQTDLPTEKRSGLRVVQQILTGIDGVTFVELTSRDVVRHRIVASIVDAYQKFESKR
jgi:phosphate starvation-inducible PhoH-like protein